MTTITKDIDFKREVWQNLRKRAKAAGFVGGRCQTFYYSANAPHEHRISFTEKWSNGKVDVYLNYYEY